MGNKGITRKYKHRGCKAIQILVDCLQSSIMMFSISVVYFPVYQVFYRQYFYPLGMHLGNRTSRVQLEIAIWNLFMKSRRCRPYCVFEGFDGGSMSPYFWTLCFHFTPIDHGSVRYCSGESIGNGDVVPSYKLTFFRYFHQLLLNDLVLRLLL